MPHIAMEGAQPKLDRASLLLAAIVFAYLCLWALPININSDGLFHLNAGRGIAETGSLLELQYHEVNHPINYPETYHVLLALAYMEGGEGLVKLLSPLCGVLVALFLYLTLRPISRCLAFVSAVAAIALLTHELIQPYLEACLLAGAMGAIHYGTRFLRTRERGCLLLCCLFVGLSMSVKQQGLYFFGVMVLVLASLSVYMRLKHRPVYRPGSLSVIVLVPTVMALAPLWDQVDRNGTLLPLLVDVSRVHSYEAVSAIVKEYILGPGFWQSPSGWVSYLAIPAFGLLALGAVYLFKRDKLLAWMLLAMLLAEVVVASCTATGSLVRQYHVVGLCLAPAFIVSGVFFLRGVPGLRSVSLLIAALILVIGTFGLYSYQKNVWGNSGRCDDQHIAMYKEVGRYIAENTDPGAVFLADSVGFLYYSLENGGYRITLYSIFGCTNRQAAMNRIRSNNVDYVFLETRQPEKEAWWNDFVPPWPTENERDGSQDLQRVFFIQNGEEDAFILYRVIY